MVSRRHGCAGRLRPRPMSRARRDYIPQMVAMIEELIAKGHAYEAEGHVLFAVESYADYGALSGRSIDDMIAGARVEVAPYKRNPMDFVLWKPSADDLPGWDSPGAVGGRAGISNARRWRMNCWATASTFTAAATICSSRTTRTRSRNRACAHPAGRVRALLAAQRDVAGRGQEDVQDPWAISLPCAICWIRAMPGEVIRLRVAGHALPQADGLDREKPGRGRRRRCASGTAFCTAAALAPS